MKLVVLIIISSLLYGVELNIADNAMVSLNNTKFNIVAKLVAHDELRDLVFGKDDQEVINKSIIVLRIRMVEFGDGRIFRIALNCKNDKEFMPFIVTTGTLDVGEDDIIVIQGVPNQTSIVTITSVTQIK